jgi:hypothetical protein
MQVLFSGGAEIGGKVQCCITAMRRISTELRDGGGCNLMNNGLLLFSH